MATSPLGISPARFAEEFFLQAKALVFSTSTIMTDGWNDKVINVTIQVSNAILSVLLVVLTLAVSIVAVIVLSCTLTQGRMSTLSIDGVTLSVWKLDSVRQKWGSTRDRIDKQQTALTDAQLKLATKASADLAAQQKFQAALSTLVAMLEQANFRIRPFDEPLADDISGKGVSEQVGRLQGAAEGLLKAHPELKDVLGGIVAAYDTQFLPARDSLASSTSEHKAAKATVDDISGQIKASQNEITKLFNDNIKSSLDDAGRAKVENALYEITPIPGFLGKAMNRIVTAPPDVLALSLVILMGILGSLLQIVNSFFRRDISEGFGIYFVRIAAGGVTALVIFIVAKAGVPIIADASRLGGDAPINPYVVSFLAIVSGLLSEQAIASVQARGIQLFPTNPTVEIPRWVQKDLTGEASSNGNSIEQLADYLGMKPTALMEILKGAAGAAAATNAQQAVIATYLHRSPREIFTDIAPPAANDDGQAVDNDPLHQGQQNGRSADVTDASDATKTDKATSAAATVTPTQKETGGSAPAETDPNAPKETDSTDPTGAAETAKADAGSDGLPEQAAGSDASGNQGTGQQDAAANAQKRDG